MSPTSFWVPAARIFRDVYGLFAGTDGNSTQTEFELPRGSERVHARAHAHSISEVPSVVRAIDLTSEASQQTEMANYRVGSLKGAVLWLENSINSAHAISFYCLLGLCDSFQPLRLAFLATRSLILSQACIYIAQKLVCVR